MSTTLTGSNYPNNATVTGQYTTSFKRRDLYSVSQELGAAGLTLRRKINKEICDKYGDYTNSCLTELLEQMGRTLTSKSFKEGHLESGRLIRNVFLVAHAAGATGAAVAVTVAAASHTGTNSLPKVGDIMQIAPGGVFVQVVGKDTGSASINRPGVDTTGAVLVPGALGGTSTAHVLVLKPWISTTNIPAITSTTQLIWHTTQVGEASCPVDGNKTSDELYEYGYSIVRAGYEVTSEAGNIEVSCELGGVYPTDIYANRDVALQELLFEKAIENQIIFVPKSDDTTDYKQSNGVIPQIQNNGGYTHTYTTWAFNDFKVIAKYLYNNGGVKKYLVKGAYDLIRQIQSDLAANNHPLIPKVQISIGSGQMVKDVAINMEFDCVKFAGVEFYFQTWDCFSDNDGRGALYGGDAIFMPLDSTYVQDSVTKKSVNKGKLEVYFRSDNSAVGGKRDKNNTWMIDASKVTGCMYDSWHGLAELCVEMMCANQWVYVKKV
ncbi:MAG: hypothetical protein U0T69_11475 [Chitinophagales bacterium]